MAFEVERELAFVGRLRQSGLVFVGVGVLDGGVGFVGLRSLGGR